MMKFVLCLLLFCSLHALPASVGATGHDTSSDPAPGRSPGPPAMPPPRPQMAAVAATTPAAGPQLPDAPKEEAARKGAAQDAGRNEAPTANNSNNNNSNSNSNIKDNHNEAKEGGGGGEQLKQRTEPVEVGLIRSAAMAADGAAAPPSPSPHPTAVGGGGAVAAAADDEGATMIYQLNKSQQITARGGAEAASAQPPGGRAPAPTAPTAPPPPPTHERLAKMRAALPPPATSAPPPPPPAETAHAICRADIEAFLAAAGAANNNAAVVDLTRSTTRTQPAATTAPQLTAAGEASASATALRGRAAQEGGGGGGLHLQLLLEHDVFESGRGAALTCGLVYRVRLIARLPRATAGAAAANNDHDSNNNSQLPPPPPHAADEFFVETLSARSGAERGSFVRYTAANKLPTSWFGPLRRAPPPASPTSPPRAAAAASSAEHNEFNSVISSHESLVTLQRAAGDDDEEAATSAELDGDKEVEAVDTEAEVLMEAGRGQQRLPEWPTGEERRNRRRRKAVPPQPAAAAAATCPDNKWHGSAPALAESTALWIINELCEQDDTIEFRVLFRATPRGNGNNNNNNNAAPPRVYKQTFTFQLRKDCQLQLRAMPGAGTLDYTALPLYGVDCVVRLPTYQWQAAASAAAGTSGTPPPTSSGGSPPPPGLLVELQRLNVPCNSGGFVRFVERDVTLCGKLEELHAADRSFHFEVGRRNSVRLHRSPMFSLRFRLVDHCYNVTASNRTAAFYVRPAMRHALECYFRFHLPYGNRVQLRLVTNNDSAVIVSGAGGGGGGGGDDYLDEALPTFYTLAGTSISTHFVNLTASGTRVYGAAHYTPRSPLSAAAAARSTNASTAAYEAASYWHLPPPLGGGASAHCDGVIIKVFEHELAKWSYCADSALSVRGFVLESAGNVLSVHLYHAGVGVGAGAAPASATRAAAPPLPAIYVAYAARPVAEIVSNCAFGWIAMQQFCVAAVERPSPWQEAEQQCQRLGGHLASIRNEQQQAAVNELLLHSPGYHELNAYWVGGSDKSYEGDFRWSDGLPFQYTNWFAGWAQHGHYNRQPNDDGLSSQDCIELRRYFRTPPGIQTHRSPLTTRFMWNDRDCNARNFHICERAMSEESLRRTWISDCNKTVSLSKEHPRASIWSPSFPRQYPDNANCFTIVTAPAGYRIVVEFEELVIENEPGCTYDYLEITEPEPSATDVAAAARHRQPPATAGGNPGRLFRKRSSYENRSLSSSSPSSSSNFNPFNYNYNYNNNNNINYNYASGGSEYANPSNTFDNDIHLYATGEDEDEDGNGNDDGNTDGPGAVDSNNNYPSQPRLAFEGASYQQQWRRIYSTPQQQQHSANFLIQTPDYPKGNPHYQPQPVTAAPPPPVTPPLAAAAATPNRAHGQRQGGVAMPTTTNANQPQQGRLLPKRLCGDWSSKLKLLRHVSQGSYLGLHFVSDYSHHFGGYKAKAYMENRSHSLSAASECANERLKPYNGSCYLFVSYPEVDWWTAQQICRGMGAKLSSVSSADEHRFITSNIRNQIDYSPQLIYWLGAELEKSGQFEWTDDSRMSFQGWLPGQGQFEELPDDATCLGLQWKMSPTPMLPSGLYWQSQRCHKIGGYVCKKPKESYAKFAFNNLTVTGTEGRLVSPAYPNTYPLNLDYWIHIRAPERTRIVVQFQKIDLEPQDECLYDFVSVQNYELVSHITLEPGSNPQPMAMLTSDEEDEEEEEVEDVAEGAGTERNEEVLLTTLADEGLRGDAEAASLHRRLQRNADSLIYGRRGGGVGQPRQHRRVQVLNGRWQRRRHGRRKRSPGATTAAMLGVTRLPPAAQWQQLRGGAAEGKFAGGRTYRRMQRGGSPSAASKLNDNPKRRRRKKSATEIENEPRRQVSRHAAQQAEDRRAAGGPVMRRLRRSTLLGEELPLSAPPPVDNAQSFLPYVRWCGAHDSNMSKFDFVSSANEVVLNFHSDYSVTGLGFAALWKAIDVSGCPLQTLTSREGHLLSPNHPHFLLNNLNCAYVVQAPAGRRVWLEFLEFDLRSDALLEVDIGNGFFRPFRRREHLNDGIFVSQREQLRVQFRTGQHPRGRGFHAVYHTVGLLERRERIINLTNNATVGHLYRLNYPHDQPGHVDYTQHLVAPFGHNILLELQGVEFTDNGCADHNVLEIYDNYADNNGTKWKLCKYPNGSGDLRAGRGTSPNDVTAGGLFFGDGGEGAAGSTERYPFGYYQPSSAGGSRPDAADPATATSSAATRSHHPYHNRFRRSQMPASTAPPVYITSYLNTLHIRQEITTTADANLNATVRIQWDNNYKMKLAAGDSRTVESCQPNPCQYNGKCVLKNESSFCQCQGHYTGRFCGLNVCELEPCVFGKCELTSTSFKCQCQPGYMGATCEQKQRPCADNPCEGRGICQEKNGGFVCRCHAWWEGHRCERRMLHIPYKPLSERMLQEPFWLGLITVFVVLAVIGLVWCAKRHFPEKIEKLLAEEADRNRPPGTLHGHHHHTSLREQLQFTSALAQPAGAVAANNAAGGAPRSIFNRLGIRKPSILSLSSPNPTPGGGGAGAAAARTFSLDDLLRPPPRRSPSPRKKRNNSTPVKKNAAEKKQILQQLVSPAALQAKPKVSLDELISMSEQRMRGTTNGGGGGAGCVDSESDHKETTFSENSGSLASTAAAATMARNLPIIDPKLEKKVTFARLLNKVTADMSSGSEIDIGQMGHKRNSSALSLPTEIQYRPSSMPPSPCTNDIRSPHSTSSNQGSDSLSSSDLALTDFGLRSMQGSGDNIGSASSHGGMLPPARARLASTHRPKVSSADSILAMFRNFAAANATPTSAGGLMPSSSNATSVFMSPATTPTASSPQDDALGDDESSTSSMHTPVSFSSGPPDSPVFYRQTTIEVPVLDVLNAHKSTSPSSSTSSSSTNLLHPPTIHLEIPSNGINKCLSPIREMPTPMPSPALTPIMPRPQRSNSPIFMEDPLSGCDFSDEDTKSDRSDAQLSEKVLQGLQRDKVRILLDSDVETTPTATATTSVAGSGTRQQQVPRTLPLLRFSPATPTTPAASAAIEHQHQEPSIVVSTKAPQIPPPPPPPAPAPPIITIDIEPPTPEERATRPRDLIIPTLTVEQPSPTRNRHPMIIFPGSPPPQRASIGETSFMFPNKQQQKRLLKQYEKPSSLDFPFVPPMITITSNMSELESDGEPLSPAPKTGGLGGGGLMPPNPVGMCYLSPFTMCSRADRTISESNLSSSGYSSMASPGPSRCGSSNPLCPNEMDEPGSGHSGCGGGGGIGGGGLSLHVNLLNRRRNSALSSCKENITNGKGMAGTSMGPNTDHLHRPRSDSETFSDDILLESNDEGISTDHVDEKLDDTRLCDRRLRELDLFMEEQVLIEVEEPSSPVNGGGATVAPIAGGSAGGGGMGATLGASYGGGGSVGQMSQLQLPSIVIQIEGGGEKGLSPVSSRSESPLSERAGIGRFSPHFYGRKDQLPFTDSDGLYDFPSSDGKGTSAASYTHQRRSSSKKRERKSSKCSATQSPTKQQQQQLDVPNSKESSLRTLSPAGSGTGGTHHVCNKHCHNSHHHPCPVASAAGGTRKSPKRRVINRLPIASSSSSSESLISAKELTAMRPMPRRLNSPNREKRPRKQESLSEEEVADALLRRISPSIVREDDSVKPKCKINRLRAIGNQIRFLRRLEKSIKTRERIASPTDSCPEENTDDMDSPQATSPLLVQPTPSSPSKTTRMALCRQRRLPGGTYGLTPAAMTTATWKGTDRSLINAADDLNSD